MTEVASFEELVLPNLDAGYNLARWLARNTQDAEDVVQDACVRALKYLGSVRGTDARPWFLTIVRNAFYDWCKHNRPAELVADDGTASEEAMDEAAIDPEQAPQRSAESRLLADAVAQLPLPFREVLILRELEDLSYKEIARIADIPIGTVMSRLARARDLLKRSPTLQTMRGQRPEVKHKCDRARVATPAQAHAHIGAFEDVPSKTVSAPARLRSAAPVGLDAVIA